MTALHVGRNVAMLHGQQRLPDWQHVADTSIRRKIIRFSSTAATIPSL